MKRHTSFILVLILSVIIFGCQNILTITNVATPTFSPTPGTYTTDQMVTISTTTSDATIYYTTNGDTPTTHSSVYNSPISVAGNGTSMTIKAIAAKTGMNASTIASASYTIKYLAQIGVPSLSPDGMEVTLNSLTIIRKTGSYQYVINYKLKNTTPDIELDEGTFILKNSITGATKPQYGFFGSLFPGDSLTRSYTFEDVLANTYDRLEYQYTFATPKPDDLEWAIIYP